MVTGYKLAGNNEERTYSEVWGEMKCLMLALEFEVAPSSTVWSCVGGQWEIGWGCSRNLGGLLGVLNTGWQEKPRERMRLPNKSGREKVKEERPEEKSPGNWKARGIRRKIGDGSMGPRKGNASRRKGWSTGQGCCSESGIWQ